METEVYAMYGLLASSSTRCTSDRSSDIPPLQHQQRNYNKQTVWWNINHYDIVFVVYHAVHLTSADHL